MGLNETIELNEIIENNYDYKIKLYDDENEQGIVINKKKSLCFYIWRKIVLTLWKESTEDKSWESFYDYLVAYNDSKTDESNDSKTDNLKNLLIDKMGAMTFKDVLTTKIITHAIYKEENSYVMRKKLKDKSDSQNIKLVSCKSSTPQLFTYFSECDNDHKYYESYTAQTIFSWIEEKQNNDIPIPSSIQDLMDKSVYASSVGGNMYTKLKAFFEKCEEELGNGDLKDKIEKIKNYKCDIIEEKDNNGTSGNLNNKTQTGNCFGNIWKKIDSVIENESKQIILYGPPGSGKTTAAETYIEHRRKNVEDREVKYKIIQFHPAYDYSDFMRGYRLSKDGITAQDKIFVQIINEASKDTENDYFLIIDEINRASVSNVFGELLMALEKRNTSITLSIGEDTVSVPPNIYIIGTMNTADKAISALDYAFRRRFSFIQVPSALPKKAYSNFYEEMYKQLKTDMQAALVDDINIEDVMPGMSYFIKKDDKGFLEYKVKYEIIPLLEEYWKNGLFKSEETINGIINIEKDINIVERLKKKDYDEFLIGISRSREE